MAIVQISRIQQRRGLNQDLPQLASAELAWSVDTRQLYIGNGTKIEGAPTEGVTEILTEYSIINFTDSFTANFAALQSNVSTLVYAVGTPLGKYLDNNSAGLFLVSQANNATINYTLTQGTKQRTGTIKLNYYAPAGKVDIVEDYDEANGTTDLVFTANANTTQANLYYTTTTSTTVRYSVTGIK